MTKQSEPVAKHLSSLSFEGSLTLLFRQKALIFSIFTIILLIFAVATLLTPRQYEARMSVLVNNGRADLVVSPSGHDNAQPSSDVSENQVNSEIELLTTNDVLTRVVIRCRLTQPNIEGVQHAGQEDSRSVESAVRKLRRNLKVTPVRKANVIQISSLASSPERAAAVLRELAAAYLDAHLLIHNDSGSEAFFQGETLRYAAELQASEDRLRQFRLDQSLTSVPGQNELLLRKKMEFESSLHETDAALAECQSRVSKLRTQVSAQEPRITTQSRVIPNQYSVERLNTMLAELENRRTQALLKYRSDDPFVTEVEQEISSTQAARDQAKKLVSVEQSTDVNPLRNTLENDLERAESEEAGLKSRRESLLRATDSYRARLDQVEGATMQHADLERQLQQSEENLVLYTHKLEEARIADALDNRKIANVAIAERPYAQYQPVKPNVALDLTLGALFAMFVSLATAFGVDRSSSSFHDPREIEAALGFDVLATVPFERA